MTLTANVLARLMIPLMPHLKQKAKHPYLSYSVYIYNRLTRGHFKMLNANLAVYLNFDNNNQILKFKTVTFWNELGYLLSFKLESKVPFINFIASTFMFASHSHLQGTCLKLCT